MALVIELGVDMSEIEYEIKDFRVLFVEDDDIAREKLGKFLQRKFDTVELCSNGLEGFIKFQENYNNQKFDLIISDINMPKMDGLEMIEEIRKIDSEVPCIFVTARNETEQLIKAINLQVRDYIIKPIDLDNIMKKLIVICDELYYKRMFEIQKNEMQNYMDILDHEALISRTDIKGKITFVNDGFCEVSGYTKEELINKSHNILRHPEVSKEFFKELWNTILAGNIWSSIYKNLAKDGSTYFVNSKIFPVFDMHKENILEFMSVNFLVTEEEIKKRKNFKNLIHQISDNKKSISMLKEENENWKKRLSEVQNAFLNLEEKNKLTESKRKELLNQLEVYEMNNLEYNKLAIIEKKDKTKQFKDMYKSLQELKSKNSKLENSIKTNESIFRSKLKELDDFIEKDIAHQKRINDLKDLVSNLQKENEELKKASKSINPFK